MTRTLRALVAAAAALTGALTAGVGATAAAAHVIPLAPLTGVSIGPVLAGESTVWGFSPLQSTDMVLRLGDPAGKTTQVLRMNSTTTSSDRPPPTS